MAKAKIAPEALQILGEEETDDARAGRILRAVCGQDVELDAGQKIIVAMIIKSAEKMAERIEEAKRKERERKEEYRKKMSQKSQGQDGTTGTNECPKDGADSAVSKKETDCVAVSLSKEGGKEVCGDVSKYGQTPINGCLPSACLLNNNNNNFAREEEPENLAKKTPHPPSREQVMMVASSNHIDKKFAEDFFDDMECDGWQYINNAGATVKVTAKNVGIVIRGRWQNLQKRKERSKKTTQPKGVIYQEADYDFSKFEGERS